MRLLSTLALAALLPALGLAQTFTDCNPTLRTDCEPHPALGTNVTFDFQHQQADKKLWNVTNGKINFTPDGAHFTIKNPMESPTMKTMFYIFFGRVETIMRAAKGQGIVSSIVIQSETLDEVWITVLHSGWGEDAVLTNCRSTGSGSAPTAAASRATTSVRATSAPLTAAPTTT